MHDAASREDKSSDGDIGSVHARINNDQSKLKKYKRRDMRNNESGASILGSQADLSVEKEREM